MKGSAQLQCQRLPRTSINQRRKAFLQRSGVAVVRCIHDSHQLCGLLVKRRDRPVRCQRVIGLFGSQHIALFCKGSRDTEARQQRIAVGQPVNSVLQLHTRIIGSECLMIQICRGLSLTALPGTKALGSTDPQYHGSGCGHDIFAIFGPQLLGAVTLQLFIDFIKNISHRPTSLSFVSARVSARGIRSSHLIL